jgi:methionyl aminopeptidase
LRLKISIKSEKEIKILKEGGKILAEALVLVAQRAQQAKNNPIETLELEKIARDFLRKHGARPSFLGYSDGGTSSFPSALCISINEEIVHGIPKKGKLVKNGDLLKLDLGVKYKNLYTDAAITVPIGQVSEKAIRLMEVTKKSLEIGMEQIYPGSYLGNYGNAVEKYVKMKSFFVVKKLVGHGVGYAVHEPPQVLNYGKAGSGIRLKKGMVIALEPMVNVSSEEIAVAPYGGGWVFVTEDGGLSAHFEHTVAVTDDGCEVLTEP